MSRGKTSGGHDTIRPGTVRVSKYAATKKESADSADTSDAEASDDTGAEEEESTDEAEGEESEESGTSCKLWLEVLPAKSGMLLAVLLTEIMTEGMTPSQMNILGNFVSAVGSLIAYKAARVELDEP